MTKKINTFIARWGMLCAFVLLTGTGMYVVNSQAEANAQTLYQTQLAGCVRANKLRTESNDRINAHLLERNVLSDFLESAAIARTASGTKNDLKAAKEYRDLKDSLKRVHFDSQPLVNCAKVIQKP